MESGASRHSVLSTKKMSANVSSDLGNGDAVPHRTLKRRAVDPVIGNSCDEWIGILHDYRPCLKQGVIIPRPTPRNTSPIPTLRDSSDNSDSINVDREISSLCSRDESIFDDNNFCPSPDITRLSNSAPCLIHTEFPVSRSSVVSDENLLIDFTRNISAKYLEEIEKCYVSFAEKFVESFDANMRALMQKNTHETQPSLPPSTPTTPTYNIATHNRFDLLSSE